jgi:hypothetical protein
MKTPYQMLHIKRLTKVANDPMVHGAGAVNVVGVRATKDYLVIGGFLVLQLGREPGIDGCAYHS